MTMLKEGITFFANGVLLSRQVLGQRDTIPVNNDWQFSFVKRLKEQPENALKPICRVQGALGKKIKLEMDGSGMVNFKTLKGEKYMVK